jgi:DNA invertase Pin-like site-specific DNA recombinase
MGSGIDAIAAKLGTTSPKQPKQQPSPAKKAAPQKVAAKPAVKKGKPARKSSGKRGSIMDSLRPKILAMEKSGKSLSAIAEELGLSNSYVWVIARNYKYDPDNPKVPKKKKVGKSKNNSDEQ